MCLHFRNLHLNLYVHILHSFKMASSSRGVVNSYNWTSSAANLETSLPSSVTTSVYSQNVELQNCQNSVRDTCQFFCGRRFLRSRSFLLSAVLVIYTLSGAFTFRWIESPAELARYDEMKNRIREKRNELVDRIASIRKGAVLGGGPGAGEELGYGYIRFEGAAAAHGWEVHKHLANLTYHALLWYENERKLQINDHQRQQSAVKEFTNEQDAAYWRSLIVMGASFSSIGFHLNSPWTTSALGRFLFVILVIPGLILYISAVRSVGEAVYKLYDGALIPILFPSLRCCRTSQSRRRRRSSSSAESETSDYWDARLCWARLIPFIVPLISIPFAEIAIFRCFFNDFGFIDSLYCVVTSVLTIGAPRGAMFDHGDTTWPILCYYALLSAFAFVWLAHLSSCWRAITKETETFKRYLMTWMRENKEDGVFAKLCLLQPIGRRPAIADTLMVKCAKGSIYKRILFGMVTLEEKVLICRHLIWIKEESTGSAGNGRNAATAILSKGGKYCSDASAQVDIQ